MSGISSVTSSALPNGGLSSVGASLIATGTAPHATAAAATSSDSSTSSTADTYQKQYAAFEQYNQQELLYASFLSPDDGLANADAVFQQAAQLLGTPGHPGTLGLTSSGTSTTDTSTAATPAVADRTGPVSDYQAISSIFAASDLAALKTFQNYVNAPPGSSILDYQA